MDSSEFKNKLANKLANHNLRSVSMKTIKRILVICSIPFLLGACSTQEHGLFNASTEVIQEMLDNNQTGFVLIKDEEESQLLRNAEKAFLEKEQTAMQFNVFRNDASN